MIASDSLFAVRAVFGVSLISEDVAEIYGLTDVATATHFGTKIAITRFA